MENISEELLNAWLTLSTAVSNERIVSEMPYNEALICNLLYRNQMEENGKAMTATDLCKETQMLKSQMNRTLLSMEEKGLIVRKRSETDKRQILLVLNVESEIYRTQHEKILKLMDSLVSQLGEKKAEEITKLLLSIADMARKTIV